MRCLLLIDVSAPADDIEALAAVADLDAQTPATDAGFNPELDADEAVGRQVLPPAAPSSTCMPPQGVKAANSRRSAAPLSQSARSAFGRQA